MSTPYFNVSKTTSQSTNFLYLKLMENMHLWLFFTGFLIYKTFNLFTGGYFNFQIIVITKHVLYKPIGVLGETYNFTFSEEFDRNLRGELFKITIIIKPFTYDTNIIREIFSNLISKVIDRLIIIKMVLFCFFGRK